ALPKAGPRSARDLAPTNRLRTEGTRNLIAAAVGAGAERLVGGSFALLGAASTTPIPAGVREAADAVRSLESQILDASARGLIEGHRAQVRPVLRTREWDDGSADRAGAPSSAAHGAWRSRSAAAHPPGGRRQRDDCRARARARRQRLRHRRRPRRQHERDGARDRRIGGRAAADRGTILAAAAAVALHGAHDGDSPPALEREGARRPRLAAVVSDDSRRTVAAEAARGVRFQNRTCESKGSGRASAMSQAPDIR